MKLKIEHLTPYLPYKLKYIDKDSGEITIMRTISAEINLIDLGWGNAHELEEFKPILRPLSDLTKEIEHNGERFVPLYYLAGKYGDNIGEWVYLFKRNVQDLDDAPYKAFQKLLSWHFDVFGLIAVGLAIDINTLKS